MRGFLQVVVEKAQAYEEPVAYANTSDEENESIVWTGDEEEDSADDGYSDYDTFSIFSEDEVDSLDPRRVKF